MISRVSFVLSILFAVVATVLVVYLTPLHHVNLVPASMNEVDPKTFYAEWQANPNGYILVDVRSASVYTSAHAQGAINIPIENMYDDHDLLPHSGKQIALICTTGRLAAIAYGYLEDQGFTNLIHIQGGLVNWVSEGLPVQGTNTALAASTTIPDEHQ